MCLVVYEAAYSKYLVMDEYSKCLVVDESVCVHLLQGNFKAENFTLNNLSNKLFCLSNMLN